ncbi:MAG TPA: beta-galactosidase [Tepidisphaeraceae bacterium]|nr:beta-galactosidase [Tepidisphaeraceae bacterium]
MAAPFFEHLEPRRLLAANLSHTAGGLVNITGTSGDDAIVLSQKGRKLMVSVNANRKAFALNAVKKIRIACGKGDDSVTWARGSISQPMTISGGAGDDTLWGSRGKDRLVGGPGTDTIDGVAEPPPTPPAPGADAMARLHGQTDYLGNGIYSSDGASEAVAGESVIGFRSVSYDLRVENDGHSPQRFIVKAAQDDPRFIVNFYDSIKTGFSGGDSITAQVTGSGWKTPTLAPGEFVEIRADAAPKLAARGNDVNQLQVHVQAASDPKQKDVIRLDTKAAFTPLPEIRRRNFDDSGIYLATVQNEGNIKDRFRLTAPAGLNGWHARYFDAEHGGHDITAAITGDGWVTPALAPKAEQTFRVEIETAAGEVRRVTVVARSLADNSRLDFARFSTETPKAGPKQFIIGVWSQPTFNFDKWKRRGINTLMKYESLSGSVSLEDWIKAANAKGLYQIREWRDDPAQDKNEPLLLAWTANDEPDIYSVYHRQLQPDYEMLKSVDPDRPVVINFAGSMALGWHADPLKRQDYEDMLPYMDWVSNGVYPVTGWDRPEHLDGPGRALDRLQKWSEGKPQLAIIESGDQQLPWMPKTLRSATRAEFRALLWDSVIRGAQGILYFPFAFQPRFTFDNTSGDIEAEMMIQHKRLADIGKVLLTPIDPPTLDLSAAAPLEATWRAVGGKKYFIVLNLSAKSLSNAKIGLIGAGRTGTVKVQGESRSLKMNSSSITDHFGPYETHIYEIG